MHGRGGGGEGGDVKKKGIKEGKPITAGVGLAEGARGRVTAVEDRGGNQKKESGEVGKGGEKKIIMKW